MCGWLSRNEHAYLENQRRLAAEALAHTDPDGPAYERVLNMRDYMGWIIDNRMLRSEWNRFKAERDGQARARRSIRRRRRVISCRAGRQPRRSSGRSARATTHGQRIDHRGPGDERLILGRHHRAACDCGDLTVAG